MRASLGLVLFASLLPTLTAAKPLEVTLASSVDGSGQVPDATEKLVRLGQQVQLHAVVRGDALSLVADVPKVRLPGETRVRSARSPSTVDGPWKVRWFRIEPVDRSLSNTDPSFHWHPIRYRDVAIDACDDRFTCAAEIRTTVLADRGGLGTMTYRVTVSLGDRTGSSPGAEKLWRGGLSDRTARVTVRRDDSYLGYLTELFNTPYIWGSAGDDRVHQAERRIGSDCADFVTYGLRRLGHDVPYTSTWQLDRFTRTLFESTGPGADGVHRTASGKSVPVGDGGVRPGDLLLFRGHVGALVRDEPPLGVLSDTDVMIHTLWQEPEEVPLSATSYARSPVRVLRWKALDAPRPQVTGNR